MAELTTPNRTRWVLTLVVVLLVALLAVLVALFVSLLRPVGLPSGAPAAKPDAMEWVRSIYGYGPSTAEQMLSPSSVAVGPNGGIYVTDPTRSRVLIFSADGTPRGVLKSETPSIHLGSFVRPEALDVAENGDIFIADSQAKKVVAFNRNKEFVREYPVDQMARGVYVADNRVYVLDVGKVIVFDIEGKRLSEFGTRGRLPGQIDAYQGIIARNGTIFIADSYNKRIQAFDESGTLLWARPDSTISTADAGSAGWDLPQDLTFNGRGELVVIDAFAFELTVVDPKTGQRGKSYGGFGRTDGEFYYPTSVAYDARRDWFVVADTQNNRVQVVRIPDSAAQPIQASVWRILSSPYRYLGPPVGVLLLALIFAAWSAWSMLKGHTPSSLGSDGFE